MIFDPFALSPTHVSPQVETKPIEGYKATLLPQLPPQDYTDTQTKPDTDLTLHYFLSQAKTPNAPLYEYSFEEEKRYSNPYLQFNPKPLGASDVEDLYAGFQGSGEQLWNALVKTGATAATSFVSSFSTLGSSIDAIRGGQPFDEDSNLGQTQEWLRELENKYPNYYTEWEREHPFISAVTPTGFANFWGDKVLKNVGFTIGSLAAAAIVDAGIEYATAGTATPATMILAANQIRKALSPLKNVFRSLAKTSTLNKVDDLAGVSRVGEGINKGLNAMNQAYNLKRGLQFVGTTYFAAQGEAMIEGYQTYWDTRAKLYEQNIDNLTVDKIEEIENTAQEAANTTTTLNLPIITASNLLQFPVIFGGKSLLKQFDSPFLEIVNKEGLTAVNNYSRKQAWVKTMKEFTKDFTTEGGEEGYQYYVGSSIHDYYVDKFNNTASNSLSEYLSKQLPSIVADEKFWESVVVGGLAGGLMGAYGAVRTNFSNERTQKAVDVLNPVLERFNSTVKDYVHFNETVEHERDEDATNRFQTAHKSLFSVVHDSLKYGVYENFQDSIEDLRNLKAEEYNKLFNTEFNETEKFNHLNNIQKESERIKSDLTEVNKFFQTNPFDSPYVNQRLRDIFKVDQTQIEGIKRRLFEDYKELTAYNISRIRNTRGRIREIEEELKMMGLDDSIIPVLFNLASKKGINEYKRLKAIQLNALEDEVTYYKELGQAEPELKLRVNRIKFLLNKLERYDKDDLTAKEQDEVKSILFKEEIGERQLAQEEEFKKKEEELRKQQEINLKAAEELQKQTTEPEKKVKEQVETVAKIVPANPIKVSPPKQPDRTVLFNKNFGNLNEGDQFKVELATEGGIFTLLTKTPFVAEKDGIKYQFLPDKIIKFENGEQVLRYSLDNIGVQKVSQPESAEEIIEPVETLTQNTFTHSDLTSSNISHIQNKLKKGDRITFFAERERTGIWNGDKIIEDNTNNPWGILSILQDTTGWIRIEPAQKVQPKKEQIKPKKEIITKQQKLKEVIDKNNRKQIIIDLLEFNGNIEQVFTKNGYLNVKGIYVHPDVIDTFNKLDTETIDLLKNNGIVYVDNLSTDGAAGVTLGYKYGNQSIMGIGLANLGLFNNPNQIALHELGHVIWEKISKEEQDLFYDGNPITEHGKRVLNPTGKFKDLYGQGSAYGEEDFAQAFAESKGNLKEVFKRKKGTTKPKKETIIKKQQLKEAVDKKKDKAVKPVNDGIYLIEGDYTNAWRYVDENTAVPLKLSLKGNQLEYSGDMTKGVEKKIVEGYLLDDQYVEEGVDIRPLLEEPMFGQDIRPLLQEELDTTIITGEEKGLTLSELSKKLKEGKETQTTNLNKFITEPIPNSLRQVLEWRMGRGMKIDC